MPAGRSADASRAARKYCRDCRSPHKRTIGRCVRTRVSRAVDRGGERNLPRVNHVIGGTCLKDCPMVSSPRVLDRPPRRLCGPRIGSSDVLIRRIAGGDQLAMRTLFCEMAYSIAGSCISCVMRPWPKTSERRFWTCGGKPPRSRRSSVSTWLLAIARYKALSARRRRPCGTR